MGTDAMIERHRLIVQPRALKRSLATRKKKARLYKRAKAEWVLHRSRIARIQYGEEHGDKHLEDRVNLGPVSDFPGPFGSTSVGQMKTRYEPENLAEIPPLDGIVLHGSGLISWFYKSELTFYNDPDDVPAMNNVDSQEINVAPKKMRPPKQRKKETLGGFYKSERFLAWKAAAPHHVDIRPEGNSMTQRFYADIILPKHIQALRESERLSGGFPHLLQEDNDPSHGTKSAINYAQLVRDKSHIQSLSHPGNSLDLSPIEAIWNIIKQRVRKNHRYKTKEELRKRC
ncbi:MAG: hypothetical protein Q9201_007728 [Fulgogasparrea decipioides]